MSKLRREEFNEQGSIGWYRDKIGVISSSNMGKLFAKIKRDKEGNLVKKLEFGETAKKYLHKKAAERGILPSILNDDLLFQEYLEEEEVSSKAIRIGEEREPLARMVYAKKTKQEVIEVGFQKYKSLFGDSPDGVVLFDREIGTLEIKCPTSTYHNIYSNMKDQYDLLDVNQDYYIQCMGHIIANNASWCDFVSFNPTQKRDMHIIRIYPDPEIIEYILEVLKVANEEIERLTKD